MEVRLLPGALMLQVIVFTMDAPFMAEFRKRKGKLQEVLMRRVISLFKEPDEGYSLSGKPERPSERSEGGSEQPLYFVELLAYLREQRELSDIGREAVGAGEMR